MHYTAQCNRNELKYSELVVMVNVKLSECHVMFTLAVHWPVDILPEFCVHFQGKSLGQQQSLRVGE